MWDFLVQVEPAIKVTSPFERAEKRDSGIGLPDK